MVDAVFGTASSPSGSFLRWPKCFSSMFRSPSLVNGFGKTSFIPNDYQLPFFRTDLVAHRG